MTIILIYCHCRQQEHHQIRADIGQINWSSGISRRDLSFDFCLLSTSISRATVMQTKSSRKQECVNINFPQLNSINLKLTAYADASYDNFPNGEIPR